MNELRINCISIVFFIPRKKSNLCWRFYLNLRVKDLYRDFCDDISLRDFFRTFCGNFQDCRWTEFVTPSTCSFLTKFLMKVRSGLQTPTCAGFDLDHVFYFNKSSDLTCASHPQQEILFENYLDPADFFTSSKKDFRVSSALLETLSIVDLYSRSLMKNPNSFLIANNAGVEKSAILLDCSHKIDVNFWCSSFCSSISSSWALKCSSSQILAATTVRPPPAARRPNITTTNVINMRLPAAPHRISYLVSASYSIGWWIKHAWPKTTDPSSSTSCCYTSSY